VVLDEARADPGVLILSGDSGGFSGPVVSSVVSRAL
jgi:hypothetical protein